MYASQRQRRFFHTPTARKKGISAATVKEFDETSKGKKLPERAPRSLKHTRLPKKRH